MLTSDDIEVLMEALDAWESKASSDAVTASMFGAMLMKDEEKSHAYMDEELLRGKEIGKKRREQTIFLKAKLLQMRDKLVVDDALTCLK